MWLCEFSNHLFLMWWFYQSLMSRFNVQGFPTILVFGADKDSPTPYEGARSASAIESFALEQLETNVAPPEVTELTGPVSSLLLTDASAWNYYLRYYCFENISNVSVQDVLEEKCGSAVICFVAFLPDILDSKAEGRNKYIQQLLSVAEKFKRSHYRQENIPIFDLPNPPSSLALCSSPNPPTHTPSNTHPPPPFFPKAALSVEYHIESQH